MHFTFSKLSPHYHALSDTFCISGRNDIPCVVISNATRVMPMQTAYTNSTQLSGHYFQQQLCKQHRPHSHEPTSLPYCYDHPPLYHPLTQSSPTSSKHKN